MTLRRADIMTAWRAKLETHALFPDVIEEVAEVEDLQPIAGVPGLTYGCVLLGGTFTPTRDAGGTTDWEGVRDILTVYDVQSGDEEARRARAALVIPAIEGLLAADRTIGTGDPQVWAEIADAEEGDGIPVGASPGVARVSVTINVLYVAASAAG